MIKLPLLDISDLIKAETIHGHISAAALAALKGVEDLAGGDVTLSLAAALIGGRRWLDHVGVAHNDLALVVH